MAIMVLSILHILTHLFEKPFKVDTTIYPNRAITTSSFSDLSCIFQLRTYTCSQVYTKSYNLMTELGYGLRWSGSTRYRHLSDFDITLQTINNKELDDHAHFSFPPVGKRSLSGLGIPTWNPVGEGTKSWFYFVMAFEEVYEMLSLCHLLLSQTCMSHSVALIIYSLIYK